MLASSSAHMPGSQRIVLVVDDDPQVLALFGRILTQQGYAVVLNKSGSEAIKTIAAHHVDLIVLDLKMPDIDGFELLKSIKNRTPPIAVIVVSGYMEGALLKASEFLGAAASISKIEAPKLLAATVARILQ